MVIRIGNIAEFVYLTSLRAPVSQFYVKLPTMLTHTCNPELRRQRQESLGLIGCHLSFMGELQARVLHCLKGCHVCS